MMWQGTATQDPPAGSGIAASATKPSPAAAPLAGVPEPSTSVIITNWNYAHFLADCIESVLGQSRHPDETIVVEDGSTDASADVLRRYAGRITVHA